MYKLEFTLKQHTPLIHFQHDQAGATLRATEVKPKLDQFIIEKLLTIENIRFDFYETDENQKKRFITSREAFSRSAHSPSNDNQKKWLKWMVGKGKNDHVALDYKLLILSFDESPITINNIKLISDADKSSIKSSNIKFSLRCLVKDLRDQISEYISEFFTLTSFGNRNNKGFGCFYPDFLDSWEKVKAELVKSKKIIYIFENAITTEMLNRRTIRDTTTYPFYQLISEKWRILKSGINQYNREGLQILYEKSYLFKYLNNKKIRWDKRWIKRHLKELIDKGILPAKLNTSNATPNEPNDCCKFSMDLDNNDGYNGWNENRDVNYEYRFGRAMLGLAEHYEFRANNQYIYKVSVKNENGFERFNAPVTFKIFKNKLYAICDPIPYILYNQNFSFEVQVKLKNNHEIININGPIELLDENNDPVYLITPSDLTEFKIDEFLKSFFSGIGFEQLQK